MIVKYETKCCVCQHPLPVGSNASAVFIADSWLFLCATCRVKAGTGYTARKIIEAWYLQFDDDFGCLNFNSDHEDYYILENLGVSPELLYGKLFK